MYIIKYVYIKTIWCSLLMALAVGPFVFLGLPGAAVPCCLLAARLLDGPDEDMCTLVMKFPPK